MGELSQWAKENSPYVKLEDGESLEGLFTGFNKSSFKGTPLIEYQIGGKILSSGSGKLATRMDSLEFGTKIKITRYGQGYDTNYEVEVIGSKSEFDEEETFE